MVSFSISHSLPADIRRADEAFVLFVPGRCFEVDVQETIAKNSFMGINKWLFKKRALTSHE